MVWQKVRPMRRGHTLLSCGMWESRMKAVRISSSTSQPSNVKYSRQDSLDTKLTKLPPRTVIDCRVSSFSGSGSLRSKQGTASDAHRVSSDRESSPRSTVKRCKDETSITDRSWRIAHPIPLMIRERKRDREI